MTRISGQKGEIGWLNASLFPSHTVGNLVSWQVLGGQARKGKLTRISGQKGEIGWLNASLFFSDNVGNLVSWQVLGGQARKGKLIG